MSSAALLTFLGAVAAAVITATYQVMSALIARRERQADRAMELQKLRREAHESYLTAYNQYVSLYDFDPPIADSDTRVIDAKNEYWRTYRNLFHTAPDNVLLAATDFHKFVWMGDYDDLPYEDYVKRFRALYATMLGVMRNDAFGQTFLSNELIEERLPIYIQPSA